jgi:hypothetical protein
MSNEVPEHELRRLAGEYRHIQGEHEREGESGSWRRRREAELSALETRFKQILSHWFREEGLADKWREHFYDGRPEPSPIYSAPRLYRGRSETGSVLDILETESGQWEYVVDDAVVERRAAMKSTRSRVELGGQKFEEAFEAPAEAQEALRAHVVESPSGEPPWEWAPALFEDGLIDMHFSLTERGRRFVQQPL